MNINNRILNSGRDSWMHLRWDLAPHLNFIYFASYIKLCIIQFHVIIYT